MQKLKSYVLFLHVPKPLACYLSMGYLVMKVFLTFNRRVNTSGMEKRLKRVEIHSSIAPVLGLRLTILRGTSLHTDHQIQFQSFTAMVNVLWENYIGKLSEV